jgi:ankyrin repeat protein
VLEDYHAEVILKLLQHHPDLSMKDKKGNGASHIALTHHNTSISVFQELLAASAGPNLRNHAGETSLSTSQI